MSWEELDWTFTMGGLTNFNITIYALYNEVGTVNINTRDILSVPAVLGGKNEKKIFFYLENISNHEIIGEIKLEFNTKIYNYNDKSIDNSHSLIQNSYSSPHKITDRSLQNSLAPVDELFGMFVYMCIYGHTCMCICI
jgi:hypothetical protein